MRAPKINAASAIGSTSTNMNRQDRNCRISPDSVGPIAGATEIAMLMLPITTPRRSIGTRVSTVVISSGIIIAVPDACTIRAGSSSQKPGETAASSVPAQNRPMASMYTVRVVSRCSRNPVVGITTAMVSMNAVVSHCPVRALTSRSAISRGSATPMIVSFRITTKAATSRVPMMVRSRALIPVSRGRGAIGGGRHSPSFPSISCCAVVSVCETGGHWI